MSHSSLPSRTGMLTEPVRRAISAALLRRACQMFDTGGQSQRTTLARTVEAAFHLVGKGDPVEISAYRACEDDPVGFMQAAQRVNSADASLETLARDLEDGIEPMAQMLESIEGSYRAMVELLMAHGHVPEGPTHGHGAPRPISDLTYEDGEVLLWWGTWHIGLLGRMENLPIDRTGMHIPARWWLPLPPPLKD